MRGLIAIALSLITSTALAEAPKEVQLFNGKDLSGWVWVARPQKQPATQPDAKLEDVWSVRDGKIISKGKPTGYLRTDKPTPANYVLTVEQRHVTKGNGGVLIGITGEDKVWPHCIEVQGAAGSMGDFWNQGHLKMTVDPSRKDPKDQTDRHTLRIGPNSERPVGEWNTIEVTVDHGTITVKVNGQVQNTATEAEDLTGTIGLQAEGAPMEFRKVELRTIE